MNYHRQKDHDVHQNVLVVETVPAEEHIRDRGCNGQNSRSGGSVRPGYEGGQMPIHRRLPKRGFTNIFKKEYAIVNVGELSRFESGSVVDEKALIQKGLVNGKRDGIKVLGKGDIKYPLTIKVDKVSSGAREKVEAAGGTIEVK